jgi:N-acetyl-anhydromuramyl-L-alanine amidase AmpD
VLYRNNSDVKWLTLHHYVSSNKDSIHHQKKLINAVRGKKISYHYIIDLQGGIHIIYPDNIVIGHCGIDNASSDKCDNRNSIGICLLGNFMKKEPNEYQLENLTKLLCEKCLQYGVNPETNIIGHKDVCMTKCPGDRFPLQKVRNAVSKSILLPKKIVFFPGSNCVEIDGERIYLENEIHNCFGHVQVTMDFFSKALGMAVDWDDTNKQVVIRRKVC